MVVFPFHSPVSLVDLGMESLPRASGLDSVKSLTDTEIVEWHSGTFRASILSLLSGMGLIICVVINISKMNAKFSFQAQVA